MEASETRGSLPVTVGVRLTVEDAKKLEDLARADDRRPSTLARKLLSEALDRATAVPA